ncbi:MAG: rubrerythrin family protein [bacterium]|nr:rubrerythrin family protein [bacterium]
MSKTQENLAAAFAGESQARNRYTYYAKVARKEGYHYIAKIFEETAENEKRHAYDEFVMMGGLGNTAENLQAAMEGEAYEVDTMYKDFAEEAKAEGNKEAAALFNMIRRVEMEHRDRYKKLLDLVKSDSVYKRDNPIRWKCAVCGYIHEGNEPPVKCPCCKHPREYYEPDSMEI